MAAIPSEFEEKEYEAPLYNQLECGTRLVWSPGQVFEEYIGVDRAIFLRDPVLWRHFGPYRNMPGAFLHRYDWEFIWRRRRRRRLPNFRLNLFLQAKRCYYHSHPPRHVRALMPRGRCWHFDMDLVQQDALVKVAERIGDRGVVAYAGPAFHRISELNAHTLRGSIVAHSTFPLVRNVIGHTAWFYSRPGGDGVANPDPSGIEGVGLEDLLADYVRRVPVDLEHTASLELGALSGEISAALRADVSEGHPRAALYFERVREAARISEEFNEIGDSLRSFLEVMAFSSAFNVEWYAVSAEA